MSASASSEKKPNERIKPKVAFVLPLILVLGLLILLGLGLRSGDPSRLPSALIGKSIPQFNLPSVPGLIGDIGPVPGLPSSIFQRGQVSLLNVWASWCAPCQAESGELIELGKRGIPIYGINYKDTPDAARLFLTRFGNPFRAIGTDEKGRTAIDFGVYGVPETFVIDGQGKIVYRFAGALTPDVVTREIMPAINSAKASGAKS